MSELHLNLRGWQHKRDSISELTIYVEDEQGQVVKQAAFPPESAEARLSLPPGSYKVYTLFVSMPYRWYAGADGPVTMPDPALVVIDLDAATVDEVLVPPP